MFLSVVLSVLTVSYRNNFKSNLFVKLSSYSNLTSNQVPRRKTMATNTEAVKGKYENIEFPVTLKLISSPNKILLDKTNFDSEFGKTEWKETPVPELESAESDKTYTLLAIDPDVPLHFAGEAILHWLVININGSDLAKGDLSKAKTILEYRGPGPLFLTGFHRYIFLVYKEGTINQDLNVNVGRLKFKLEQWIKNQSIPLEGPVAGIQFKAKY